MDLRSRFREFREAGALHRLVAVDTTIDEQVLATKGGDLVSYLSVRGIDPECREPADLELLSRRLERALTTFDERFRIYTYFFKREHDGLTGETSDAPVINAMLQNRLRFLNNRLGQLFTVQTAIVIVFEGWRSAHDSHALAGRGLRRQLATLKTALSRTSTINELNDEFEQARDLLLGKVQSFVSQLQGSFDVEILDCNRAFQIQRQLLNTSFKATHASLSGEHFLDVQACSSMLECHREYLRLDEDYVAVLTLKELPPRTCALMLSALETLPCPMVAVNEWRREDKSKMRRLIHSRRRHFHNSKTSLPAQLTTGGPGASPDVLVNNAATALIHNLGACLEEIDVKGRHFGEFSSTIVLREKDAAALRRAVAQCLRIFSEAGAQLNEERYNRLNAWAAVQPGNAAFNLRRLWVSDRNAADLSLLFAPATGHPWNSHLKGEYLAVFEGRSGSPYFFNLHWGEVGHTFVCGETGSGKSFLLNFLLTHLQKYAPCIRIFDLGHSYASLTRMFHGSYLPLRAAQAGVGINPFCLPPTTENLQFLFAWVRVIIGPSIDPEAERDLYEQIETLYELAPEQRRLSTLARIVHASLRRPLERWCQGGPYGWLFDNPTDTLTLSAFQTFDFEGMAELKEALEPLLFYVLHRASAAISESPDRLKVFVMDEAWRFFAHPVIKAYIVEALKTWRKKNACMILATQSVNDLTSAAMLPVVMENSPTQIFLANPRMDRAIYANAFHLSERETELIASLLPRKEFLLKRPDHSKVIQLNVGPKEYWTYTTSASDASRRRDAFAKYGFEEGLEQLAKEMR